MATGDVTRGLYTINKASQADTVTLASNMSLSYSGQDLTLTTGCLDMAGFDLTVGGASGDGTLTLESGTTINQGGGTLSYGNLVDNGGTLDGACPVGVSLAINSTNPSSLTESNLNTATVTVDLTSGTFDNPVAAGDFSLNGAPTGTTISAAAYVTATQATLTLAFDSTDFDTNASMSVTVLQTALVTGLAPATTGTVTVTAEVEVSLAINSTNPGSLTETNLDTATVTVDLTDGTFNNPLAAGYFSLTGAPAGTTISAAAYVTATQGTLTLAFDATDFDTNASMSVTALQTALLTGTGPATTGTVTVTAVIEPLLDQIHYRWRNDDGGACSNTTPTTLTTPGTTPYTVPAGCDTITVEAYGAGGGGAEDGSSIDAGAGGGGGSGVERDSDSVVLIAGGGGAGGANDDTSSIHTGGGGGGGYAKADFSTSAGATFTVYIGGGGKKTPGGGTGGDGGDYLGGAGAGTNGGNSTWGGGGGGSNGNSCNGGDSTYGGGGGCENGGNGGLSTYGGGGAAGNQHGTYPGECGTSSSGTGTTCAGTSQVGGGGGYFVHATGTNKTELAGTTGTHSAAGSAANSGPGVGGAEGSATDGGGGQVVITASAAGASFAANQDAALSGLTKNTTKRLRLEISNEGTVTSGSVKYRLEVSEPNPPSSLCASATTWTRVETSTHWNMAASTHFADADATLDNPGLDNANPAFKAGELKEYNDGTDDDQTLGITLTTTEFTELEYAIAATNSATGSGTYCFRLTGEGSTTGFQYTEARYGKVTLGPDLDFGFRKPITIDRSKLPTGCGATLSNYPLLFSVTDLESLSTASGQVTDPEGDDIMFRALDDDTCGGVGTAPCTLDHEMESYNATTGAVVAWVRLSSVKTDDASNTTDTKIYVYYGNTDIDSSIENINDVWDTDYVAVWHLKETGNATLDEYTDSSGTTNDGQGGGGTSGFVPTVTTGQIGNGQSLDGGDDWIGAGNDTSLQIAGSLTVAAWVNATDTSTSSYGDPIISKEVSGDGYQLTFNTDTDRFGLMGSGASMTWGAAGNGAAWHHVVGVFDGTTAYIYVDGVSENSGADTVTADTGSDLHIGAWGTSRELLAKIDEVRISKTDRSACWIAANYNNHVWPDKAVTPTPDPSPTPSSGFFTLGTEESTAGLTAVELISFTATGYDRGVLLDWRTGYEVDNLGFHVYREQAGERIQLTPALIAGSGLLAERGMAVASELAYAWWDLEASRETPDIAYWLEDVDFDGTSTWHGPVTPVDGGHLIDVGPPGPGEGVEGSNSRSLEGLGQDRVARRHRFLTGDAPGRPGGDVPLPRPQTPLGVQWLLAGQPGVKLGIEQAGWYRVSQPALVAAGLDPSVHPRALRLVVDGVEQALHVTGSVDGRFDPEDAIEFYGEGVDTAYTGTRVYWLAAGAQAGQRVRVAAGRVGPVRGDAGRTRRGSWPEGRVGLGRDVWLGGRAGPATGAAQATSFWGTLEQKARSIYFAALRNGEAENWFGPLVWAFPTDLVLTLANLDPAAPSAATLEVTLQGVTRDDAITPDHTVTVLVNGTAVGDLRFDGRDQGVQTFAVPHALLLEGANTVQLVAQGAVDYSLVDTLRLSYWHTYEADADRLRFVAEGQEPVTVGGFASGAIRVVDVTDPAAVEEVLGTVQPEAGGFWSITVVAPGTGPRTLLAFTEATVGTPAFVEANQPSTWHLGLDAPDYLVITHETFVDSLAALVALRAQQGYTPALIDIEDVYDEFSFGQKTPQALKDFLTHAQTGWVQPPRFAVLAGDATIDPRDYAGFGDADFVPTKLVDMDAAELESATDEWFADADADGLPELAVGRLPMRTLEQAETMVTKLVTYAQAAAGAWTKEVVLLADSDDPTWSFEVDAAQIRDVLPAGYTAHAVLAGAAGGTAAARTALLDLVGQGQLLVNQLPGPWVDLCVGQTRGPADERRRDGRVAAAGGLAGGGGDELPERLLPGDLRGRESGRDLPARAAGGGGDVGLVEHHLCGGARGREPRVRPAGVWRPHPDGGRGGGGRESSGQGSRRAPVVDLLWRSGDAAQGCAAGRRPLRRLGVDPGGGSGLGGRGGRGGRGERG